MNISGLSAYGPQDGRGEPYAVRGDQFLSELA